MALVLISGSNGWSSMPLNDNWAVFSADPMSMFVHYASHHYAFFIWWRCVFQMKNKSEPKPLDRLLVCKPAPHLNRSRQSLCSNLTTIISPNSCTGSNSAVETRTIVVTSDPGDSADDLESHRRPSASSTFSFVQQRANHVVRISSLWPLTSAALLHGTVCRWVR